MTARGSIEKKKKRETSRASKPPQLDAYVERLLQEDNDYLVVLGVRDELIENVIAACYEKYIQKQSVQYLAHCLRNAYVNALETIYLPYPKTTSVDMQKIGLGQDEMTPLPPDNYAEHSVSISEANEDVSAEDLFSSTGLYTAQLSEGSSLEQGLFGELPVSEAEEKEEMEDEMPSSLFEQVHDEQEDQATLVSVSSELFDGESAAASFFTNIAEADCNLLPPITPRRCENLMSHVDVPYERKILGDTRLPKSFILPPLRLRGKFKNVEGSKSNIPKQTLEKSASRDNFLKITGKSTNKP